MISLALAVQLKEAGVIWQAGVNDFFAIPERGMDDRLFVLSDMMANLDVFRGWPVVTFHGAAEWALDYILTSEVVWMPTESQLREMLEEALFGEPEIVLELGYFQGWWRCSIQYGGARLHFDAPSGSDAYAQALLHILRDRSGKRP